MILTKNKGLCCHKNFLVHLLEKEVGSVIPKNSDRRLKAIASPNLYNLTIQRKLWVQKYNHLKATSPKRSFLTIENSNH